jgi:hypothetical protein
MKTKNIITDPVNTIIDLTYRMEQKEKFAFVNISRSAINSLLPEAEKKPPKYFLKAVSNCIEISDPNFLKAIPSEYLEDVQNGKYSTLGIDSSQSYYDANMFDFYYSKRKEVVDTFINHYIKDSKNVILSFHDKKTVEKVFGQNQAVITVAYNNYYERLDAIVSELSEFDGLVDYVILDCPLLATAIAPKIWNSLTMSIIDFGKIVSSNRYQANNNFDKERSVKRNFSDKDKGNRSSRPERDRSFTDNTNDKSDYKRNEKR